MMDFFKNNPAALMDALPTPPGSDDGGEHDPLNKSYMSNMTKKSAIMSQKSVISKNNMRYKPPTIKQNRPSSAYSNQSGYSNTS